jgi:hypothetical protein
MQTAKFFQVFLDTRRTVGDSLRDGEGGGPSGLEVKATGDTIDVEDFTCKE